MKMEYMTMYMEMNKMITLKEIVEACLASDCDSSYEKDTIPFGQDGDTCVKITFDPELDICINDVYVFKVSALEYYHNREDVTEDYINFLNIMDEKICDIAVASIKEIN